MNRILPAAPPLTAAHSLRHASQPHLRSPPHACNRSPQQNRRRTLAAALSSYIRNCTLAAAPPLAAARLQPPRRRTTARRRTLAPLAAASPQHLRSPPLTHRDTLHLRTSARCCTLAAASPQHLCRRNSPAAARSPQHACVRLATTQPYRSTVTRSRIFGAACLHSPRCHTATHSPPRACSRTLATASPPLLLRHLSGFDR
jgi:hypothetical protein